MQVEWPRRVLLTGDTAGGVWTFALQLASELRRRSIAVTLATFGPEVSEMQRSAAARVAGLDWHHHTSRLEWMEEPWHDLLEAQRWLEELASAVHPDVVHLNTLSFGNADYDAPVIQTVHSCVCSWFAAVRNTPAPATWQRYRDHVTASLNSADFVTAPSEATLRQAVDYYKVDRARSRAIHNGIASEPFKPLRKEPFVLAAGRIWDEGKNISTLAAAGRDLSWPVYIAGNSTSPLGGSAALEGCQLLGELGREELANWYGRASVYALPARYEPFGLSCLEAAFSGCALVLGDIPSLREIWQDSALFVAPDDSGALQSVLEDLISNPPRRAEMAARALSRAHLFSASRMADAYLDVYRLAFRRGELRTACAS